MTCSAFKEVIMYSFLKMLYIKPNTIIKLVKILKFILVVKYATDIIVKSSYFYPYDWRDKLREHLASALATTYLATKN